MKNINIAEILQYAPKGIELYSNIYGPVKYENVKGGKVYFKYVDKRNQKVHRACVYEYGNACFDIDELNLKMAKQSDNWNNWQNILLVDSISLGCVIMCTTNAPKYSYRLRSHGYLIAKKPNGSDIDLFDCNGNCWNRRENGFVWTEWRYANHEETEHYFELLRKAGQYYDAKTQTLVKYDPSELKPVFKCGDIVKNRLTGLTLVVRSVNTTKRIYETNEEMFLTFDNDQWEKVGEQPNQNNILVFQKFQEVFVRNNDDEVWLPTIYGYTIDLNGEKQFYNTALQKFRQCIPICEDTEALYMTSNKCAKKYIQWL